MHGLTRTASNWSECRQATKLVTFNGVIYGIFVTGPIEAARQAIVVAWEGTSELPVLSSRFRLRATKRTFGGQEGTKHPARVRELRNTWDYSSNSKLQTGEQ
jgi:hypothetical protein